VRCQGRVWDIKNAGDEPRGKTSKGAYRSDHLGPQSVRILFACADARENRKGGEIKRGTPSRNTQSTTQLIDAPWPQALTLPVVGTLQRDLDPTAGTIDLYPQEITRVLASKPDAHVERENYGLSTS
jgi:hypothetical protein